MKREVNSKQRILNPILTEYQPLTLDNYINYPNEVEAEFYTRIYAKLSNELENEEILNILNSIKQHSHKIELLPILEVKKYVSKLEPKIIGFLSTFFDECFAISDTISCDLDRRKPHSIEAKKIVQIIESIQTQNKDNAKNNNSLTLTAKQKALIAFYTNETITREKNGNHIYNEFSRFSIRINRIGDDTERKIKNRLKLFESILEHLPENKKDKLLSEIETIKTKL